MAGDDSRVGRGGSFEDVYAATADRLVRQIYRVTGDLEEARDCVQEGFARVPVTGGRA
jgi:DNA-directed RNA polymerase specialized sigma24 family protein